MAKLNAKKSHSGVLVVVGIANCRLMFPVAAAQPGQTGRPADARLDRIIAVSKIAFAGDREGQSRPDEIYVMNANGTGERRRNSSGGCTN
jgi:hypothetical protein